MTWPGDTRSEEIHALRIGMRWTAAFFTADLPVQDLPVQDLPVHPGRAQLRSIYPCLAL